jgi:threonine/homoserine/homoserine lactone efflux protein
VLSHIAAFLGVSAVVICTPGPDTALTVRNTLVGGRRGGLLTAVGVATGLAVWTIFAAAGVAALLRASEPAFLALRVAGSAYLIYLGAHALWAAVRRGSADPLAPARRVRVAGFRQGLLSNLGNPKVAVFFVSLLPQFGTSFGALLGLGLAFAGLTLLWLTTYAFAVTRARRWLARSRVRRTLDAITGTVLVAFGIRLATEHR